MWAAITSTLHLTAQAIVFNAQSGAFRALSKINKADPNLTIFPSKCSKESCEVAAANVVSGISALLIFSMPIIPSAN